MSDNFNLIEIPQQYLLTVDDLLKFLDKRSATLEASPLPREKSQPKIKSTVHIATSSKLSRDLKCIIFSKSHKLYK